MLLVEAEPRERLNEAADLGVHAADRTVVPVAVVIDVSRRIEAGLHQLVAGRHAEQPQQRILR